ncbi:transmembrane protein UsgS [Calycina marina]|uniref:Transmembrane protein UsgS n=1 Tax=Calycina marina TaxID=1763456 RepID=A0A9P8CED3_9HELO|nr:transmembrane protein UsgS [Calycina marina]
MAEPRNSQRSLITKKQLKKRLEVSNFDPNAILRGAQLTVVGALRALQNPALFTSEHYKQAAIAVAVGIAIRLAISIPVVGVKVLLWFLSFVVDFDNATWDDKIVNGLHFTQNYVLQIPFFLMSLMRYVTPTLDNMFMESLAWVDQTYYKKHEGEDPSTLRTTYYPNLRLYQTRDGSTHTTSTAEAVTTFMLRFGKKASISLAVFALSYVPYIGRIVLPAASFYTFNKVAGLGPAAVVFGTGIFLPRRYLIVFLQSYFASRSLVRELLEPYFSRIHFTKEQKKHWFHDREGLLFGFGVGFYIFQRIPLLGVLVYGIAEASTAYLITKITDPPPPPAQMAEFAASQQQWTNKHEFLGKKLFELEVPKNTTLEEATQGISTSISTST